MSLNRYSDGFHEWLQNVTNYYSQLSDAERNLTIDYIIEYSGAPQLRHLHSKATELLYRDFFRLLPIEVREHILSYLDGITLLNCCSVSRTWNNILSSSSRVWIDACQRSGLVINKNSVNNVDENYWKSFFIQMTIRRHQMINFECFTTKTYERNLRRVTAVYYYEGKVATASDSKVIQVWDCVRDKCVLSIRTDASISSIKFDDRILVASSYLGHMVCWCSRTGKRMTEFMRHVGAIFTFDFSHDLNIIASGAADCRVKLWTLSSGYLYKTVTDHSWWVLKVMLTPYPAGTGCKEQDRHLLLTMDKTSIIIKYVSLLEDYSTDSIYMTNLYCISLNSAADISLFTPGLHFDGQFLYYINESLDSQGHAILFKYDVRTGQVVLKSDLNLKVKALLGIGKKYVAILTPWQDNTVPNFIVLDKETHDKVALWIMPPSKPTTPDCAQVCLGETSWLDGLDGKNDEGVVFASAIDDNCVLLLKWMPKEIEDMTLLSSLLSIN